jgi:hypothetical protein
MRLDIDPLANNSVQRLGEALQTKRGECRRTVKNLHRDFR